MRVCVRSSKTRERGCLEEVLACFLRTTKPAKSATPELRTQTFGRIETLREGVNVFWQNRAPSGLRGLKFGNNASSCCTIMPNKRPGRLHRPPSCQLFSQAEPGAWNNVPWFSLLSGPGSDTVRGENHGIMSRSFHPLTVSDPAPTCVGPSSDLCARFAKSKGKSACHVSFCQKSSSG